MIGRYGPPVFQILRGLTGAYNVALMKAVPKDGLVSKAFLFYLLQESKLHQAVVDQSQRSAGQSGVNKPFLESYEVSVPPLVDQVRIAAILNEKLSQSEELSNQLQEQLEMMDSLPALFLEQAFAGEL